jgi:hypothetical protein
MATAMDPLPQNMTDKQCKVVLTDFGTVRGFPVACDVSKCDEYSRLI